MKLITGNERDRLNALERIVNRGQRSFVEVGLALCEIRDSRLYRQDFETFEEYCKAKWGWTRQRAYQLIEGAETAKELPKECQTCLTNPRQIGAVASVPKEKRADVIGAAQQAAKKEGKPLTARHIKEAAESAPEPEPQPEEDAEAESPHVQTLAQIAEAEAAKTREILDQIRGIVRAAGQLTADNQYTVRAALREAAEELQ